MSATATTPEAAPALEPVWYAGYGSNLDGERFRCYLEGGRPPGAARHYPGARDTDPPGAVRPVTLAGRVRFAWESSSWGGGVAFYDPTAAGRTLAAAYLVTRGQFADVLAQEMARHPESDVDLAPALESGRHELGPGHYETVHVAGEIDGRPVLTFSAADVTSLAGNPPSAAYLTTIVRGLRAVHGLGDAEVVGYLTGCEGLLPRWDHTRLGELVAQVPAEPG